MLEHRHIHNALSTRGAHHGAETAQRRRGISATAHSGDRRQARIVPGTDHAAIDQVLELALTGDRVAGIQAREFILSGTSIERKIVDKPLVQRPVIGKLQSADRVRNPFDGVFLPVRKVVGRVDRPGIAGLVMMRAANPVQDRIAHVHVRVRHIDPGAQHPGAVLELTRAHAAQKIQILTNRALAIRAVAARLRQRATIGPRLFGAQIIDIGFALLHQVLGPAIQLLEVAGRKAYRPRPAVAEPAQVGLNRLDELLAFFLRVGVVETQMAHPAELRGQSEIHAD